MHSISTATDPIQMNLPEPEPTANSENKPNFLILFTGQVRTLLSTVLEFKRNILDANKSDYNIEIYGCLEYPETCDETVNKKYIEEVEVVLNECYKENIKRIKWLSSLDSESKYIREKKSIDVGIMSNYLSNSGSIIEYYQLYRVLKLIKNPSKYAKIMRVRLDIYFPSKLLFKNMEKSWTDAEQLEISHLFPNLPLNELKTIFDCNKLFKNWNDALNRMKNKLTVEVISSTQLSNSFTNLEPLQSPISENIIYAYRNNLLYLSNCSPILLETLQNIIWNYGLKQEIRHKNSIIGHKKDIIYEQNYLWNAENQFELNIVSKNFKIFNSYSDNEESSLYSHFNPDCCLFCVKR